MSIKVKVSPRIVSNIAKIYQSTSRIFMEYIDNSLDSAEKLFEVNNKYPYPISINIKIDTKEKSVIFEDNCVGMDKENLLRIVENIGDSNKKNDFTTNGQFGFGIHAYAACADKMEVLTLTSDSDHAYKIIVDRSAYTEEGEIPDLVKIPRKKLSFKSGTIVKLTDFDNDWWKDITVQELKDEIEKHFEQLLARDQLQIKIIYDNKEEICQSFNYDSFLGEKIEKNIVDLERRGVKTFLGSPVKIYLKITEDIIPNKRPVFVNKGRRIEEVQAIKSFRAKSKYRTGLWAHNNLTGYIEVAGLLNPTLPRDDFERSTNRQMIYEEILKIEDEIHEALQLINKRSEGASMNKFEDLLSSALSKLARQDYLRFRTQIAAGNDINFSEIENSDLFLKRKKTSGGGGGTITENHQEEEVPVVETQEDSDLKGKERKKSGFNVEFSDREQRKADGTIIRSDYIEGGAIVIYKSHPDFQERVKRTYQGEMKITERLISYLASEIAIQYKDKFFSVRGKQPEVQAIMNHRKDLFIDIVDFSYQFEKILQPFVGKNLLTLEEVDDTENYEQ
jgi:hypothetical protein